MAGKPLLLDALRAGECGEKVASAARVLKMFAINEFRLSGKTAGSKWWHSGCWEVTDYRFRTGSCFVYN